jgi:hypothetical protein
VVKKKNTKQGTQNKKQKTMKYLTGSSVTLESKEDIRLILVSMR